MNDHQKKRRNKRNWAKNKMLASTSSLLTKCHWCGMMLVWAKKLTVPKVIDQRACKVSFGRFEFNMATVDHVIPLSKGGNNHISNLVPSCNSCNAGRGAE